MEGHERDFIWRGQKFYFQLTAMELYNEERWSARIGSDGDLFAKVEKCGSVAVGVYQYKAEIGGVGSSTHQFIHHKIIPEPPFLTPELALDSAFNSYINSWERNASAAEFALSRVKELRGL